MEESEVGDWFAQYLSAFAALGRLQGQADAMSAAGYSHTETLASDVAILNRNTAVHHTEFSRQRAEGTEIHQMSVTYVITRGSDGYPISTLVLRSP